MYVACPRGVIGRLEGLPPCLGPPEGDLIHLSPQRLKGRLKSGPWLGRFRRDGMGHSGRGGVAGTVS